MSFSKLLWLAVAAFAIGTEGYVVAGLLPDLAASLHVSVAIAGQLITVFALAYAVGSPLLAVVTGGMERRRLLLVSIAAFAGFNLFAATAHSYAMLMLARVGLALSAGTFMPAASAYAVAVFPAERRGRALAVIYGGFTVAMVLGAPLGLTLGGHFGWRYIFFGVAAAALAAFVGLAFTLGRLQPAARVSLADRLTVARRPDVLAALAVTVVALAGVYSIYSFLAPFLQCTAHLGGNAMACVFFVFGVGSTFGNLSAGSAADRIGPRRVLALVFIGLTTLFTVLSLASTLMPPDVDRWIVIPLLALWGYIGFSFPAAQQSLLVTLAPRFAPITLSLNASAMYLGVSLGAFLGSLVVARGSIAELGWLGAGCEILALILLRLAPHPRAVEEDAAAPAVETFITEIA